MACLQRGVKDVCEHRRKLISTVLQGGWRDRVWPGCFAGVLSFEQLNSSRMERVVVVVVVVGPRPLLWWGSWSWRSGAGGRGHFLGL